MQIKDQNLNLRWTITQNLVVIWVVVFYVKIHHHHHVSWRYFHCVTSLMNRFKHHSSHITIGHNHHWYCNIVIIVSKLSVLPCCRLIHILCLFDALLILEINFGERCFYKWPKVMNFLKFCWYLWWKWDKSTMSRMSWYL